MKGLEAQEDNNAGTQKFWNQYQWLVIGLLAIIAAIFGFVGFQKYYLSLNESRSVWDIFYSTLRLFTLEFDAAGIIPWELQVSRFLAPAVVVYTAIKAIIVLFSEQVQLFKLRFVNNHVVICGLGNMGQLLASAFCEQGYQVVCLNLPEDSVNTGFLRNQGAIVLAGNPSDSKMLRKARIDKAKYLFSMSDDDGKNADIGIRARTLVKHRTTAVLNCYMHISNLELVLLLKEKEITTQNADAIRINFFNVFDSAARALLQTFPSFEIKPEDTSQQPRILLVGLSHLGESILLRSAWLWNIAKNNDSKLLVTLVDRDAKEKIARLTTQHPSLNQVCEFNLQNISVSSAEFNEGKFLREINANNQAVKIYVCLGNDSDGFSAALGLRQKLTNNRASTVICMQNKTGLAKLLRQSGRRDFDNIEAFGLLERTCQPDLLLGGTHEILARAIHEDYVKKEKEKGMTPETNPSMASWEQLPGLLKESNRNQADYISKKLKRAGCDIRPLTDWNAILYKFDGDTVERLAEFEHERWNDDRLRDGWRYAPGEKNTAKKTSPWLVEWEKLPDEIKEYDRNTITELPRFLAKAGFEIYDLK